MGLALSYQSTPECVDALGLASPLKDVEAAIEIHGRALLPRCAARLDAEEIASAISTHGAIATENDKELCDRSLAAAVPVKISARRPRRM
ncbi:hypothetical protein AX768_02195 [Burkholderia sp. PAMC 28687]|uniref:hypothetical protein n=1 Tax=Burkholderia sp. PAMC 28687 TaxID=1795874 RepID=UPI0007821623|nr:hypothetical protein [Burkholderia sp. PAMC 28687]AMM13100.1 hypothetical protein AX768_02195 [Burkholderia sp. PAMC 28687]